MLLGKVKVGLDLPQRVRTGVRIGLTGFESLTGARNRTKKKPGPPPLFMRRKKGGVSVLDKQNNGKHRINFSGKLNIGSVQVFINHWEG